MRRMLSILLLVVCLGPLLAGGACRSDKGALSLRGRTHLAGTGALKTIDVEGQGTSPDRAIETDPPSSAPPRCSSSLATRPSSRSRPPPRGPRRIKVGNEHRRPPQHPPVGREGRHPRHPGVRPRRPAGPVHVQGGVRGRRDRRPAFPFNLSGPRRLVSMASFPNAAFVACGARPRCAAWWPRPGWGRRPRRAPVRSGGHHEPQPIASLPGVVQHTRESLVKEVRELAELGVPGVILFGVPARKDATGSGRGTRTASCRWRCATCATRWATRMVLMADLCLDEYTDHGHCGVVGDDGDGRQRRHHRAVRRRGGGPGRGRRRRRRAQRDDGRAGRRHPRRARR